MQGKKSGISDKNFKLRLSVQKLSVKISESNLESVTNISSSLSESLFVFNSVRESMCACENGYVLYMCGRFEKCIGR